MKYTALILLLTSILFFSGCGTQTKPLYVNVDSAEQELQQNKLQEQEKKLQEQQKQLEELKRQLQSISSGSSGGKHFASSDDPWQNQVQNQDWNRNQRVRVNQEIVSWIQQLNDSGEDITKLIFYLDKSFSMEIEETGNSPIVDIASDGMLVINAQTPQPPINFSDIQQGKIMTFTPDKNDTFVITTQAGDKHVAMRFRKNAQNDYYYEVYSMVINSDAYTLKPLRPGEDLPILYIYASIDESFRDEREYTADYLAVPGNLPSDLRRINEIRQDEERLRGNTTENEDGKDSIAEDEDKDSDSLAENDEDKTNDNAAGKIVNALNDPAPGITDNTSNVNNANENRISDNPAASAEKKVSSAPKTRTANLIGSGTLTRENVVGFVKARTRHPVIPESEITKLINLYIEEALYEEVNHDIAIAQMLYMTRVLGNSTYIETNNYAGLIPVQGRWDGSFETMLLGVRAHIQHLRGYARDNLNRAVNVNPRWNQISDFRGTITTLDELYQKWSSNPAVYKENIDKMLSELYSFSEK